MKYSKSTRGFYDAALHGLAVPADAVDINPDEHAALLSGQSSGQLISAGADGIPALINPPAPTQAALIAQARARRQALLGETDYLLGRDYPLTGARLAAVKAYRQALRDVPAQPGFPESIDWPVLP